MKNAFLPLIVIAACVFLTFGRLCTSEFTLLDDNHTLAENPDFNPPTVRSIMGYWKRVGPGTPGSIYIPLTNTVWGVLAKVAYLPTADDQQLHLNPFIFHTANVTLHLGTALVVFALLNLLVADRRAALLGALFYALHPVMVEPVAWVSGMKDVLAGLLSVSAIYLYARFRQVQAIERSPLSAEAPGTVAQGNSAHAATGSIGFLIGASALFALALLSKPSAIAVPALVIAMDMIWFKKKPKETLLTLLPWFVLAIGVGAVAAWTQRTTEARNVGVAARPFIAGDAIVFYLRQIVLPLQLGVDYGRFPSKVIGWSFVKWIWVVPVLLLAGAVLLRRRAPLVLLGAIWFVIPLAPVLGFVPFQFQGYSTVADHYLYVAMLGMGLLIAVLMARFNAQEITIAMSVVLALLALRSIAQARVWENSATLFTNAVRVNPESYLGWTNLGINEFNEYSRNKERGLDDAVRYLTNAAMYSHNLMIGSYENLAIILIKKGEMNLAIQVTAAAMRERLNSPMNLRRKMSAQTTILARLWAERGRPDIAYPLFQLVKSDRPDDAANNTAMENFERKFARPASTAPATVPTTLPVP